MKDIKHYKGAIWISKSLEIEKEGSILLNLKTRFIEIAYITLSDYEKMGGLDQSILTTLETLDILDLLDK